PSQVERELNMTGPRTPLLAASVAVALVALALPFVSNSYVVRLATLVAMYAALGQAWNLIGGYTGYPAFGHTVFFGLGAYSNAIAMLHNWPFLLGLVISGIVASICAVLIGALVLRLQGHYFAIVTLGIGEVARELVLN